MHLSQRMSDLRHAQYRSFTTQSTIRAIATGRLKDRQNALCQHNVKEEFITDTINRGFQLTSTKLIRPKTQAEFGI